MKTRLLIGAVFALLTAAPTPPAPPGPETLGQWSGVMSLPIIPIHSHMLPTGKVIFWDRHISSGAAADDEINPRVWDPVADPGMTNIVKSGHPLLELFCSAHVFLRPPRSCPRATWSWPRGAARRASTTRCPRSIWRRPAPGAI
jgi:hypothetical protein